jgi:hypothetical protein
VVVLITVHEFGNVTIISCDESLYTIKALSELIV